MDLYILYILVRRCGKSWNEEVSGRDRRHRSRLREGV